MLNIQTLEQWKTCINIEQKVKTAKSVFMQKKKKKKNFLQFLFLTEFNIQSFEPTPPSPTWLIYLYFSLWSLSFCSLILSFCLSLFLCSLFLSFSLSYFLFILSVLLSLLSDYFLVMKPVSIWTYFKNI